MTSRIAWRVPCLILAALVSSPAFAAFECPVSAKAGGASEPALATSLKAADDPRSDSVLRAAIAQAKMKGLTNGTIIDQVIADYCPVVAASSTLSDRDKDELVTRFASHLTEVVYAPHAATVDSIILDVPVPPDLFKQVTIAADKAKISRDDWILQAVRSQLVP